MMFWCILYCTSNCPVFIVCQIWGGKYHLSMDTPVWSLWSSCPDGPITETVSLYKVFSLGSSDWKLYNVTLESRDWTEVVSLGSFLFIVGLLGGGTNRALYCNSFQWYGVIWRETSKSVRGRVARSKWWVGAASSKWCEGKSWEADSPHWHIPLCTTTCKHNFTLSWNTHNPIKWNTQA